VSSEFAQPPHLTEPTDDLSAGERRALIASMRPSDAEGVPELHEVDVPPELRERIEESMSLYPQLRSAAIPVLWHVQRHYGWCTPEGIREAAAVMGVTPAYLQSVASFYDLFATSPVGRHRVLVCHNISCWMRGADELLDAFCEATGADPHEADRRRQLPGRRVLRQGVRVPGRLRHRADGLDRRALLRPADGRRRARGRRGRPPR
jgi:NADH:ubiquinone oxidoreductase subunit E